MCCRCSGLRLAFILRPDDRLPALGKAFEWEQINLLSVGVNHFFGVIGAVFTKPDGLELIAGLLEVTP
jgi:hypothetical protein